MENPIKFGMIWGYPYFRKHPPAFWPKSLTTFAAQQLFFHTGHDALAKWVHETRKDAGVSQGHVSEV